MRRGRFSSSLLVTIQIVEPIRRRPALFGTAVLKPLCSGAVPCLEGPGQSIDVQLFRGHQTSFDNAVAKFNIGSEPTDGFRQSRRVAGGREETVSSVAAGTTSSERGEEPPIDT